MRVTSDGVRAALITVATVAAPLLPLLVAHHVLSADDATQAGSILAAVIAAFHGGRAVGNVSGRSIDAHVAQALAVAEPDPTMPAPTLPTSPAGSLNKPAASTGPLRIDTAPTDPQ